MSLARSAWVQLFWQVPAKGLAISSQAVLAVAGVGTGVVEGSGHTAEYVDGHLVKLVALGYLIQLVEDVLSIGRIVAGHVEQSETPDVLQGDGLSLHIHNAPVWVFFDDGVIETDAVIGVNGDVVLLRFLDDLGTEIPFEMGMPNTDFCVVESVSPVILEEEEEPVDVRLGVQPDELLRIDPVQTEGTHPYPVRIYGKPPELVSEAILI